MKRGTGKGKLISLQMLSFEFRKAVGNPYVHIFGVGMPVLMMLIITYTVGKMSSPEALSAVHTSIFLGMGPMIPMATLFIGYGVSLAQEEEKGIPQRMELFGISASVTLCNRILAELIFMLIAFVIYYVAGYGFVDLEVPTASGAALYALCILALSGILFVLSHSIASLLKKFGLVYCVTMLLYFGMMILGGMMGVSYDNLPAGVQVLAKLLPVTYISRDAYQIWSGESYQFGPMLQAYLLLAAVAGILLFFTVRHTRRKLH